MRDTLLALRPVLLRVVGYPLFFLFFFVTFLYVTFPYDRLKEVIIAQLEAPRVSATGRQTPSNMEITIDSLGPTFFPGLKAKGIRVTALPTVPGERPTFARIDEAVVRVSLFSLLFRRANVHVDIEGMGGTISGDGSYDFGTHPSPGLRALSVTLDGIAVSEVGPLSQAAGFSLVQAVGLPLGGTLRGTISLTIPDGQVNQTEGRVELTCARLTVGDNRAQYQIPPLGGVTIAEIRAGDLALHVNIRRGIATFERVAAQSNEFALQMDGRIALRPNLNESTMDLGVRFRFTDAYRNKSEQAARILTVMDMVPELQRARRPDGMIGFRCTGTFARSPVCGPDTRGVGAPDSAAAAAPAALGGP